MGYMTVIVTRWLVTSMISSTVCRVILHHLMMISSRPWTLTITRIRLLFIHGKFNKNYLIFVHIKQLGLTAFLIGFSKKWLRLLWNQFAQYSKPLLHKVMYQTYGVVTLLALIDCMLIVTSRIVNLVILVISLVYNCFIVFICCMSNLASGLQ